MVENGSVCDLMITVVGNGHSDPGSHHWELYKTNPSKIYFPDIFELIWEWFKVNCLVLVGAFPVVAGTLKGVRLSLLLGNGDSPER